jgi:hypothetical protein
MDTLIAYPIAPASRYHSMHRMSTPHNPPNHISTNHHISLDRHQSHQRMINMCQMPRRVTFNECVQVFEVPSFATMETEKLASTTSASISSARKKLIAISFANNGTTAKFKSKKAKKEKIPTINPKVYQNTSTNMHYPNQRPLRRASTRVQRRMSALIKHKLNANSIPMSVQNRNSDLDVIKFQN